MTGADVTRLIEAEVAGDWDRENLHGCTVRRCLIEPERRTVLNPPDGDPVDVWIVLEEEPETRDGYKVIYDDVNESFGLAYPDRKGVSTLVGLYGSFLTAYDGM